VLPKPLPRLLMRRHTIERILEDMPRLVFPGTPCLSCTLG
jgi:hypothetical protein